MANAAFLTKIFQSDTALNLHTNAGTSRTKMKGFLGSIEFWLDPYAIASVVSLRTLERKFPRVCYDSTRRNGAFIVETPLGEVVFNRCEITGFPYIDLTEEGDSMAVQLLQATSAGSMTAAAARQPMQPITTILISILLRPLLFGADSRDLLAGKWRRPLKRALHRPRPDS